MNKKILLLFAMLLMGIYTINAQTWHPNFNGSSPNNLITTTIFAVHAIDANHAVACGDFGLIETTNDGGATWVKQAPFTSTTIRDIFFISQTTGWVVGNNLIAKTTDGGVSWQIQNKSIASLFSVHFQSVNLGWAVGSGGTILHTTDGGANWSIQTSGVTNQLTAVTFTSAADGYAVGAAGRILKTIDGGLNWTSQIVGTTALNAVSFANSNDGYMSNSNTVYKTNDAGVTWAPVASPSYTTIRGVYANSSTDFVVFNPSSASTSADGGATYNVSNILAPSALRAIHFANTNLGYFVGTNGLIYKTIDGGLNWVSQSLGLGVGQLNYTHFPTTNVGYAVGNSGVIIKTTDGGYNWTKLVSGTTNTLRSVHFSSATEGWAVGDGSTIVHTSDGGVTWSNMNAGFGFWRSVWFSSPTNGCVVAGVNIKITTDGGLTWTTATGNTSADWSKVQFSNITPSIGWVVGYNNGVSKTTDGGLTWTTQFLPLLSANVSSSVSVVNDTVAYIQSNGGGVVKTIDGGNNWIATTSTTYTGDIHMVGIDTGYALVNGLTIYHSTNGFNTNSISYNGANSMADLFMANKNKGCAVDVAGGIYVFDCVAPLAYPFYSFQGNTCAGTPTTMQMQSSQFGFKYQLKRNGINVPGVNPISGGNAINFGTHTIAGVYTVEAYSSSNTCPMTTMMLGSVTINPTYTIAASAGVNGTISSPGNTSLCSGDNITYTITPDPTFSIADVLVDGVSVGAVASYTFSNVTSSHSISASFVGACATTYETINASICQGSSYTFNGIAQTTTGTYLDTLVNAGGCDSILTLTLNVSPIITPTFSQVAPICSGAPLTALPSTSLNSITGTWAPAMNNLATTTYTFTPSSGQCILNATMTIAVNANPSISNVNVSNTNICAGSPRNLTATGVSNLPPSLNNFFAGAGSIPSANSAVLTITPIFINGIGTLEKFYCNNVPNNGSLKMYLYDVNGGLIAFSQSTTQATSFTQLLPQVPATVLMPGNYYLAAVSSAPANYLGTPGSSGCFTAQNIDFNSAPQNLLLQTLTPIGATSLSFGIQLSTPNLPLLSWSPSTSPSNGPSVFASPVATSTYTVTATNSVGCTATSTVLVNVTPITGTKTTQNACDSYTWPLNNQTYSSSGTYYHTVACVKDTLVLIINASTSNTTSVSACDSYTWSVDNMLYTQSGTYTHVNGCHTEMLDLTITPSTSNTTVATSCDTYSWSVNNTTYSQSGTYASVNGCQTEILDLTITPSTINTSLISSCGSYTWPVNNTTYSQSGTYTSVNGCHTENLNLTINPLPIVTAADVSACAGNFVNLIGSPAGGTFNVANPYSGPSTTYTYTYTDGNGCTTTSAPANIYTSATPPVTGVNMSNVGGNTATVNWNGIPGLSFYEIRYRAVGAGSWTGGGSQSAPNTFKTIVGLTAGTPYEIEVRGFCGNPNFPGPWSATTIFSTSDACVAPTNLNTVNITGTTATMTWTPVPTTNYYQIRYRTAAGPGTWVSSTITGTASSKNYTGLTLNTDYEWQIRAICNPSPFSTGPWSGLSSFTTLASKPSLEEMILENNILVYPNPATSVLMVDLKTEVAQQTVVKLYDISGRLVKQMQAQHESGTQTMTISLNELSNGMYTVQVICDDVLKHTSKISKQD